MKEVRALEVLNEILSGGPTSRLYSALVRDQKVAAGAGSYYDATSYDPSIFVVYGTPASDATIDQVEAGIWEILQDILNNGVGDDELQSAKNRLLASAIYARDSVSGAANIFGAALTSGEKIENIVNWPRQITEVTKEEINRAARKLFDEKSSVVGKLLPEEK